MRKVFLPLLLCCTLALNARMIKKAPVGEIPFVLDNDNRIYVTAFINGSDSLRFLVDTGASSLVMNTNSPKLKGRFRKGTRQKNLGTTGSIDIEYSFDNTVLIGSLLYEKAGCAHIPFSPDLWDGVFGLNALSAYNIEINYDDYKIYCYSKELLTETPEGVCFPFTYRYNVPFIHLPVKVKGILYDCDMLVDTGSDRVIDLNTPFVAKHHLSETQEPFAISRIESSDNGSGELRNVFFDEVAVGPYILPRVAGAFSTLTSGMQSKADVDGMIGNNFLKRFNMFIDFHGNHIYLCPNNYYYTPFYDFLVK